MPDWRRQNPGTHDCEEAPNDQRGDHPPDLFQNESSQSGSVLGRLVFGVTVLRV